MLVEFPSQKWMDYLATITGLWQPPKLYHNQMWANSSLSLTECNTTVAIGPFWNANFNINQKHSLLWSQANSSKHVSNADLLCPKLHTKLPGGPRRIESANVAQATMHLECDTFEKMLGFLDSCASWCSHLMTLFPCMVPILALEFCFTPSRISSCPEFSWVPPW